MPAAFPPLLLAFLAIGLLCAMDAAIKWMAASHAVVMVAFLRYFAGALMTWPLFVWREPQRLSRTLLRGHAVRGAVLAISGFLFFYGLSVLPIAEAVAISFIAPLLVPPMAALLLGERVRRTSVLACIAGFGGTLLTISGEAAGAAGPDRLQGIAAVLASAVLYALSAVLLRGRAKTDGAITITFLAALFPALFTFPFALTLAPLPGPEAIPGAVLIGALGTAGILLLSRAYARAEAQVLIVVEYTALGWAAAFGYVLFRETVRIEVLLGAAIIAGACLFAGWDDRRRALAGKAEPAL